MKLEYTVEIWREDAQFIAHAMPLDVASSGPTPDKARQAVDEAVRLFLSTAAGHGTLREVLEDAGYRRLRGEWRAPAWSSVEQRSVLAEVVSAASTSVQGLWQMAATGLPAWKKLCRK